MYGEVGCRGASVTIAWEPASEAVFGEAAGALCLDVVQMENYVEVRVCLL